MTNITGHTRFTLFTLLIISLGTANAKEIKICTDSNNWYPFTYEKSGVAKGMHIDIAAAALETLEYQPSYTPLPWKRCLLEVKVGKYDALISGSYKPDRAEYLYYPEDAATAKISKHRLMQVSYIVVSNADDPYVFSGDLSTLPGPVRAPLGYSIVDDLRSKGIDVSTTSKSSQSVHNLVKSQKGVFITTPLNAKMFNSSKRFARQLRIHETPIKSKSYFMLFSKQSAATSQQDHLRIWEEIVKYRDNEAFMEELSNQYEVVQ